MTKNTKTALFLLSLGFCLFASLGCAGMVNKSKTSANPSLLEPQTMLKFSDIPVPVGFKLLPAESYTFESSGMRVGVLRYQGKVDADQVVGFYKEQMPMYSWNLLNIVEYGDRLMNFDRESETCIVNLSQKGNFTIITLSVGPKGQVSKKPRAPLK